MKTRHACWTLISVWKYRLGNIPSLVLAWRPNHALKLFLQNARFFRIHTPQECTPLPHGSEFHTIGCQIHLFEKTMTVQSKQITVIAEAAQTASDFQLNALTVVELPTIILDTIRTQQSSTIQPSRHDLTEIEPAQQRLHVTSNNIAVPKSASL